MIQVGCKKHPSYTANRKPLGPPHGCFCCNLLWNTVNTSLVDALGETTMRLSHFRFRPGTPRSRISRHK